MSPGPRSYSLITVGRRDRDCEEIDHRGQTRGAADARPRLISMSGRAAVGSRVSIFWAGEDDEDGAWWDGRVVDFSPATDEHLVKYDDGEQRHHRLAKENIKWLSGQDPSSASKNAAPAAKRKATATAEDDTAAPAGKRKTAAGKKNCSPR